MNYPRFDYNFTAARFTAIISDLHLCEAETERRLHPLWKKFKTREFFFDESFSQFLKFIEQEGGGQQVELILNGDIFDFDSVMSQPHRPPYKISWLERSRGLFPQEPKSTYKINKIISDHPLWFDSLSQFIKNGHRVVFVLGNHDLELHFKSVRASILEALRLTEEERINVRFNEWFYISNQDTLVEHGNQYDPYCVCQDPINPLVQKYNQLEIRLPFGNLACRYMINGMGFFNPHSDSNYIMSAREYVRFFSNYLIRTQPLIIWTWFWGAMSTLMQSFGDRLLPERKDPLTIEDKVDEIARKANSSARMVRELSELRVHPASGNIIITARELWLDRAFMVLFAFLLTYLVFVQIKLVFSISLYWMFIPLFLFLPFFIFYAKSITPKTVSYKEPKERILSIAGQICKVNRVIYGHTHIIRHEWLGEIEHLNSGTWSPAFLDVECTKPIGKKTFIWLEPDENSGRRARVYEFANGQSRQMFGGTNVRRRAPAKNKGLSYSRR